MTQSPRQADPPALERAWRRSWTAGRERVVILGLTGFAILVVAICFSDGLRLASPPRSNFRFSRGQLQVFAVSPGDLLDRAGVLPGDSILAVNGHRPTSGLEAGEQFRALRPGDEVRLVVLRDGEEETLSVTAWENLRPDELVRLAVPVIALVLLGAGVALVRPGMAAGRLLLLFCLSSAVNDAALATLVAGSAWPQRLTTFAYTILSLPSSALLLHLFLSFPVRGRVQRLLRPLLPFAYGVQLATGLSYYLPTVFPGSAAVLAVSAVHGPLLAVFGGSVVGCYLLAAASLFATAVIDENERTVHQARLLALGFLVLAALQVALYQVPLTLFGRPFLDPFSYALLDLIVPGFVAVAVLVHRLFEINLLVRHGLVYGAASIAVAGVFVASAGLLGWVAGREWPGADTAVVAMAAATAALLFHPLRTRVQELVDRFLYRRRYNFRRALTEAGARLNRVLELPAAGVLIRALVEEALAPQWLEVVVRQETGPGFDRLLADGRVERVFACETAEIVARRLMEGTRPFVPHPGELPWTPQPSLVVPLGRQDGILGALFLGPRAGEVPYLDEDLDFLTTLASLSGVVLENAHLLEERSARERLALLGSAASRVVHELKNPLGAVKSTAAVLRRRLRGDPRGQELTEIIERETDRLQARILEVLSFVRPQAQAGQVVVDVEELVRQLGQVLESELAAAGVTLEVAAEPVDVPVAGNPERIRQALLNLVLNAREAMPGGGAVRVTIAPRRTAEGVATGVEVAVSDNGPGFSPAALERAFEPFFSTKRLGTGLGLANVRQVVAEHSGTVELGNPPGGGGEVRLFLPRADPNTSPSYD